MTDPSRRDLLSAISTMGVAAMLPGVLGGCGTTEEGAGLPAAPGGATTVITKRRSDLIRDENEKPGARDWMLTKPAIDHSVKYRCPWIEGYFSRTSVRAGETISLHVSTNPESKFTVDLYRMGYYGGAGARRVTTLGPFPGGVQEDPLVDPHRLRVCRWEPCTSITIPNDWPSGIYLAKLTAERESVQSYAVFVVRDNRRADFMFQCSDTTWQAYNRWPSQYSLYDNGANPWYWGAGVDISFDRPYGKYCQILDQPLSTGSGEWLLWEFPLAFWMEQQGYDVTYVSNLDLHADASGLKRAKGFLSVGHDEYYSLAMFQHLKQAIADGLNVAFLSGNTCCGLIEFSPGKDGTPNRILRRLDRYGPPDEVGNKTFPDLKTLPRQGPNEATLIGARSTGPVMGGAPWTCAKPDHWLFKGTGMKEGEGIPGLVGWEWHGDPADIPGLEIVAKGETTCAAGKGLFTSTVYPGAKGNIVFNAATCWWADGLSAPPGYLHPKAHGAEPKGPDPRCQKITANLLERMRSS
ncbi:MAG TPA: N,N-dimethylformamidase beta subunit family domain-containing protein [Planctomycetota bacterium]|nr:N,N-dimethylformamidase beta subunit family domain-containing protein [Planctomycetota bacterium]